MTLFTAFHQFIRLPNGGASEDEKQSFCYIIMDLQFRHILYFNKLTFAVARIIFPFYFPHSHSIFFFLLCSLFSRAFLYRDKNFKCHILNGASIYLCVCCIVFRTQFHGDWNSFVCFPFAYNRLCISGRCVFATVQIIHKRRALK